MSFTDQKPFVATVEDIAKRWVSGFHCKMCGQKFVAGSTVRWVYANSTPGMGSGNFFVCDKCDGPNILERAKVEFDRALILARRWGLMDER